MSHHFAGAGDVAGVPLKSTVSNCDSDRACPTLYLLRYRYFNLLYYYRTGTLPSPLAPPTTNRHPVEYLRHWFCDRSANAYYFSFCHLHLAKAQRVSLPGFLRAYSILYVFPPRRGVWCACYRTAVDVTHVLARCRGPIYIRTGSLVRKNVFLCYVLYVVYLLL